MTLPSPSNSLTCVLWVTDIDGTSTKKQRDLAEGVHDDMHAAAKDTKIVGKCGSEDNVRELANRGVGETLFYIVAGQCNKRCKQDRDRRQQT